MHIAADKEKRVGQASGRLFYLTGPFRPFCSYFYRFSGISGGRLGAVGGVGPRKLRWPILNTV